MSNVVSEQRQHARFAPTVLRADVEWEAQRVQGYLMNLSLGGALLALTGPPPPDTEMTLHVVLPWGLGECSLAARCVWEQEDHEGRAVGAGVAFDGLPEATEAQLRRYLDRYAELATEITA